jgi:hypothetical protein
VPCPPARIRTSWLAWVVSNASFKLAPLTGLSGWPDVLWRSTRKRSRPNPGLPARYQIEPAPDVTAGTFLPSCVGVLPGRRVALLLNWDLQELSGLE